MRTALYAGKETNNLQLEWLFQLCGSAMSYIGLGRAKCLRLVKCINLVGFVSKKSLLTQLMNDSRLTLPHVWDFGQVCVAQ